MFHFNVDGELFYGSRRVIKTKEEARMIFEELHSSPIGGHTGIGKTRAAICARFDWYVDIENWVCVILCSYFSLCVSTYMCVYVCMFVCIYFFLIGTGM